MIGKDGDGLHAVWDRHGRTKRARLRRIKTIATALLPVLAAIFVVAAHFAERVPALAWVVAFSEAALVGGLADWFAIVALFRHPAGLPLPHTAIIPRNKDRIGTQLGVFVEANFLTPANVAAELRAFDLAGSIVRWFADPINGARVVSGLREFVPHVVDAADDADVQRVIVRVINEELERADFARVAARLLSALLEGDRQQQLLDQALLIAGGFLNEQRGEIKRRFAKKSLLTPPWLDSYIVNRFVDGIVDLTNEIAASPDHEIRNALNLYLRNLWKQLRSDSELAGRVEGLKSQLIAGTEIEALVRILWHTVKARALALAAAPDERADRQLADVVARLAREVLGETALLGRLENDLAKILEAGLERFQHHFASLIETIVVRWDVQQVTDKVELELGPDLQFIRLNGTIVGGLAGVVLHGLQVVAATGAR